MYDTVEVSFRDLAFKRAPRHWTDRYGNTTIRWLPIGMPVLADNLTKCVFYLYAHDPQSGIPSRLGGTGFFVAKQSVALPYTWHVFAVSNRHVVQGQAASCLRINTKQRVTRFIEYEPTDWICSQTDDLAIIDVSDQMDFDLKTALWGDDISWVDEINFAPEMHKSPYGIGIGDNTIMVGLFADHSAGVLNAPLGRFGNVAAMPDSLNPVRITAADQNPRPAYLNDIRSRTGFSGSPVWVWRTPQDDMNHYKDATGIRPRMHSTKKSFLALIGVQRAQFPDKIKIRLTATGHMHDAEIPSSMTVIVPAWEISNLMNDSRIVASMAERDSRPDRIELSEKICALMDAQEARLRTPRINS